MPWQESSAMEQRLKFLIGASKAGANKASLCREFGISRQTGYTWLERFQEGGSQAVAERSRRPKHSPNQTKPETEARIVELRKQRPDWGAMKLHYLLKQESPELGSLSVRTVQRVIERHHLVNDEDRPAAPALRRFERQHPNELWQMDFKGPQGFNKACAVGPLSILDDHSRYLIALEQLSSTKAQGVKQTLRRVFEAVGQPAALLVDHGTPWWNNNSPWGLTELNVWVIAQGIQIWFSGVRHPQTQGKVERMHGALQRAVRKRKADPEDQQWLDQFRQEYNCLRPHQGLNMATPASRWQPSSRPFRAEGRPWEYPAEMTLLRVEKKGYLLWNRRRWAISSALRDQVVGLLRVGERVLVYFCNCPVRELDPASGASLSIPLDILTTLQYCDGKEPHMPALSQTLSR